MTGLSARNKLAILRFWLTARYHRLLCPLGLHMWVRRFWYLGMPSAPGPWYCTWCRKTKARA
jgi:hypothetical protein